MVQARTPQVRRTEAESRLVAAAAELVGEVGPAGVTLANVGERAGYSRGLATHHFGSKAALMQRLVDTVTQQFREAMLERGDVDDPLAELRTFVDVYFDALTDLQPVNRARLALWADAAANPDEDIRARMVASDAEFRVAIADRLPDGVHRHGLATVVIAMLRGVALQSLIDEHVDLESARGEIDALLTHRLESR